MMADYAIKVTDKNAPGDTAQAIVGTPEWAEANLGGDWVAMPELIFTPSRKGNTVADFIEVGDCWEWTANKSEGYGLLKRGQKQHKAHRYVYEALVGPIPEGMTLDHLCRNRSCVNPDHLEPVTFAENARRSPAGMRAVRKAHCKNGHRFDEANTYMHPTNNSQRCRACHRDEERRYHKEKRHG